MERGRMKEASKWTNGYKLNIKGVDAVNDNALGGEKDE